MQYDLYGGTPPHSNNSTSLAAAESIKPHIGPLAAKVYRHIVESGGATCDEIERATGMRHQTASARVRELREKGHIKDSDKRRRTRSGRQAIVWVRA